MKLDHERLDVYHAAIELVPLTSRISDLVPRGHASLGDQLRRAATSISLNIAEGAGEFSAKEKARFYRMAKRSATESAAILDVVRVLGLPAETATHDLLDDARGKIVGIVSMLVRMVQRVEERFGQGHAGIDTGNAKQGEVSDPTSC